eukprot:GHUV01029802.1.p1 GENE.GHUV01029802.1~~GHUV01029802.1.p1  ORF type:complete len:632 (+),score=237.56 GHUV01029802.1:325-2220(+)
MTNTGDVALHDRVRVHAHEYSEHVKLAFVQLAEVWQDLETTAEQQKTDLESTFKAALNTWTDAVGRAKDQQQQVRSSIQQMLAQMMEAKEALGADDPSAEAELQRLQGSRSAHKTLRAWQKDVQVKASYWEKCRLQRVAEYEDLQARILALRKLCGLGAMPAADKPDISKANMVFLKLELERLSAEKERREDLLRRLLAELHSVCDDIGEDVKAAAAEVHPNLVYMWDEEAAKVLRDVYKLSSTYTSGSTGGMIDLSDSSISRLSAKLGAMKDLKASRAAHAAELLGVLHSLWDATEVPAEERAHFVKLMSGPLRLHGRSLEKCMSEVRRLEDVRTQQMVDLVNSKGAELRAMCRESHVAEPAGLVEALTAINSEDRNPGAAAELLAKLLHMLAEVQVLTGKRSNIIAAIKEVEAAQQEDAWLAAYEVDEQRYKGRDANKKLQRAIKAAKVRDRLPAMLADVRVMLDEWRESEGEPFMYDGKDYQFEVLDVLAADVEEKAAARAAKAARSASSRRQSVIGSSNSGTSIMSPGPARGAATPGRAGAPPRPASAVGSPGARRADGPATPIPLRSVSSKTLHDRHSICVVRYVAWLMPNMGACTGCVGFVAVHCVLSVHGLPVALALHWPCALL